MNWIVISIVVFLAIVIVVFTIIRNNKDRKDLEEQLNNDYSKLNEDLNEDEF